MESESIRVNAKVVQRLRRFLADRTGGKLYGEIGKTAEKAIEEWLDRNEQNKRKNKK